MRDSSNPLGLNRDAGMIFIRKAYAQTEKRAMTETPRAYCQSCGARLPSHYPGYVCSGGTRSGKLTAEFVSAVLIGLFEEDGGRVARWGGGRVTLRGEWDINDIARKLIKAIG